MINYFSSSKQKPVTMLQINQKWNEQAGAELCQAVKLEVEVGVDFGNTLYKGCLNFFIQYKKNHKNPLVNLVKYQYSEL